MLRGLQRAVRIRFNEKTFIAILLILLFVSVTFSSIQSYRLERLRQQYYKVGIQLEAARNKQQSIRDNVERTGALLSESAATIGDIKRQIAEIRASYEFMERLLYSSDSDCDCRDADNIEE